MTPSAARVSDEQLRNTRAWAAARIGTLSGADVIVAACDEALASRSPPASAGEASLQCPWCDTTAEEKRDAARYRDMRTLLLAGAPIDGGMYSSNFMRLYGDGIDESAFDRLIDRARQQYAAMSPAGCEGGEKL